MALPENASTKVEVFFADVCNNLSGGQYKGYAVTCIACTASCQSSVKLDNAAFEYYRGNPDYSNVPGYSKSCPATPPAYVPENFDFSVMTHRLNGGRKFP